MDSYQVENTKQFMSKLLVGGLFDDFFFESGRITTFNTFTIDGLIKKDFFSEEELDSVEDRYSLFSRVRPIIYEIIKGKNTPLSFQFVLYAPLSMYEEGDYESGIRYVLNIRFEDGHINCISAISREEFSLDKTADGIWDKKITQYLEKIE